MDGSTSTRPWWQRGWFLAIAFIVGIALPIVGRVDLDQCDHEADRLAPFTPNPQIDSGVLSGLRARDAADTLAIALGMEAMGMALDETEDKPLSWLEEESSPRRALDYAALLSKSTGLGFGVQGNTLSFTGSIFVDRIGRNTRATNGYCISHGIIAHLIAADEYHSSFDTDHLYLRMVDFPFAVLDQGIARASYIDAQGQRSSVSHNVIYDINSQLIAEIPPASQDDNAVALEITYQAQECFLTTDVSVYPDDFGCVFKLDDLSATMKPKQEGENIVVEFSPSHGKAYEHGPVLWILDWYTLSDDGTRKDAASASIQSWQDGSKISFAQDRFDATDTLVIRVAFAEVRTRTLRIQLGGS